MKKRIICILFAILLIIGAFPFCTYADGTAPETKAYGTDANFAKDAPITTVRIDRSKINRDNALLYSQGNTVSFYLDNEGYVYADNCNVKSGYTNLGKFSLTFENAAILANGESKNLVFVFDDITVIGKSGTDSYTDYLNFAKINNNQSNPLSVTPLSVNKQKHIAIRYSLTVKVSDADESDTFLFAAKSINVTREGNINFEAIVDSAYHYAYSESVEPMSGIADGSDIYITSNSKLRIVEGKTLGSYGIRYVGGGNQDEYSDGFATVATAKNGLFTRVWSSTGVNTIPLDISLLTPVSGFALTTKAGENGSIDLWADGVANSTTATKLNGGTESAPLTYFVPNEKPVTLVIKPDKCYDLDTLSVDGTVVQPTRTVMKANGLAPDYYEYDIPADTADDIAISATFSEAHFNTLTHHPRVEPTATDDGNIEYWECTECGNYYADKFGTNEITDKNSVILPAVPENDTTDTDNDNQQSTGSDTNTAVARNDSKKSPNTGASDLSIIFVTMLFGSLVFAISCRKKITD